MVCQMIRILLYRTVDIASIMLIDLCCQCCRNAEFLQIDHCLPHILLLFYL